MSREIIEVMHLKSGMNAFLFEYSEPEKLYIRRYVDRKWYEEGKDFEVISNGKNTKVIIFKELLNRTSDYEIYKETTNRVK